MLSAVLVLMPLRAQQRGGARAGTRALRPWYVPGTGDRRLRGSSGGGGAPLVHVDAERMIAPDVERHLQTPDWFSAVAVACSRSDAGAFKGAQGEAKARWVRSAHFPRRRAREEPRVVHQPAPAAARAGRS